MPNRPPAPPQNAPRRVQRPINILISLLAAALFAVLSGCAPATTALTIPVTGAGGHFNVHEYAVVEESRDNPTSASFQQRVQAVVEDRAAGWSLLNLGGSADTANQALAAFDYHLQSNPTPPFSAYALYHNQNLIARDIASFTPVALKDSDFQLAFETLDGQRLAASLTGIRPLAGAINAPVSYGDQLVYAQSSTSDGGLSLAGPSGANRPRSGAAAIAWRSARWALSPAGHVLHDGEDLSAALGYQGVLAWRGVAGQPLYFYVKDGLTHLAYAGQDLRYSYDQVLTNTDALYAPGDDGRIFWFYALRDGVWYYVEAGLF